MQTDNERKFTLNYKLYLEDKKYKDNSNLVKYWNQMQDFFEGKQIPQRAIEGLPKFVANICSFLVRTKASKIIGTPYTIVFQSAKETATNKLGHFDKFVLNDLQYSVALQETVQNVLTYGTAIEYYRFDENAVAFEALYEGKLVREHIDLRKFAVANNYLNSIQKQKWLMYWSFYDVSAVRAMCTRFPNESEADFKKRVDSIVPDNYDEENQQNPEMISHGVVQVYTRFFRKNGEVAYQSSTKYVNLFSPRFLSPSAQEKVLVQMEKDFDAKTKIDEREDAKVTDFDIDPELPSVEAKKDKMTAKEYQQKLSKFSLYPFVDFAINRRFNHFYGISDLQDYISAQQVVNYLYTLSAKNIQDNAWGKWITKAGALNGQKINNNGGQVLIDYSRGSDFGVKRVEANSGNMINVVQYIENIIATIRTLSGSTEVISGENASQLSGYAISLLQEQGNTVFEMIQSQIWNGCAVDEAKIRLQFYEHYYDNEISFIYELDDMEYQREKRSREWLINHDLDEYAKQKKANPNAEIAEPRPENYAQVEKYKEENFSNKELKDMKFYIVPKAGRGIKYSEVVQADQINQLFKDGNISKMSASDKKAYIELNTLIDETTKAAFKKIIEEEEQSQNAILTQQVQELTQVMQDKDRVIQSLQYRVKAMGEYIKNLQSEFSGRLNAAKQQNDIYSKALELKSKANEQQESSGVSDKIIQEGVNAAIAQ